MSKRTNSAVMLYLSKRTNSSNVLAFMSKRYKRYKRYTFLSLRHVCAYSII